MGMENNRGGQATYLIETLKSAAIHAMAIMSNKQTGNITIVAVDAQIQHVVQNLGHHVQASLKSAELDIMGLGDSATRAHILDGEHCMWR